MKVNVHAGHNPDGKIASGAVGFIKESTQARAVTKKVVELLKAAGHTVYNCTCSDGTSQNDVLKKIVKKCNVHEVDIDVSIHFNSGAAEQKANGKTTGTEVLVTSNESKAKPTAEKVLKKITALGFRNRGIKVRNDLYVLKHTKAPAMLIECCFVDDKDDAKLYSAEKMAKAIAEGIIGTVAPAHKTDEPNKNTKGSSEKKVKVVAKSGLNCRKGPGKNYGVVCAFPQGKILEIREEKSGWGKCNKGWVKMEFTKKV